MAARLRNTSLLGAVLVLISAAARAQQPAAPDLVPQMGSDKACARVAFSPNGQLLITSSLNGTTNSGPTLQLWETSTGSFIRDLRMQPRLPWSSGLGQFGEVAFSPDGQYVVFFERYALAGGPPKPNDIVQQWQTTSVWEVPRHDRLPVSGIYQSRGRIGPAGWAILETLDHPDVSLHVPAGQQQMPSIRRRRPWYCVLVPLPKAHCASLKVNAKQRRACRKTARYI